MLILSSSSTWKWVENRSANKGGGSTHSTFHPTWSAPYLILSADDDFFPLTGAITGVLWEGCFCVGLYSNSSSGRLSFSFCGVVGFGRAFGLSAFAGGAFGLSVFAGGAFGLSVFAGAFSFSVLPFPFSVGFSGRTFPLLGTVH